MSYDFALQRYCSHEVWFETAVIDANNMNIVRFQRNPTSNSVVLYIDGVEVPKNGLFTPSFLSSMKKEPFRIRTNVNDLVYIKIGNELPKMIQLISGSSLRASDIIADLKRKIPELNFQSINGRVTISSKTVGQSDIFSFVDPSWTDKTKSFPNTTNILNCYKEIGINPGRVCYPKKLFPGWDVMTDINASVPGKLIVLDEAIKNDTPFIQLTYVTSAADCRRCFGSKIEFDYGVYNGTYESVINNNLLLQEFDKFLFTRKGSHWKWPWLGSNLSSRIGGKNINELTNSFISMDISQAFRSYQSLKAQQDSTSFQQVTDEEYPLDFVDLSVVTDPNDPTTAMVSGSLVSRSRNPIELTRLIGDPSLALPGAAGGIIANRG